MYKFLLTKNVCNILITLCNTYRKNNRIKGVKNNNGNINYDKTKIATQVNNRFTEIGKNWALFQILVMKSKKRQIINAFVLQKTTILYSQKQLIVSIIRKWGIRKIRTETLKRISRYVVESLCYILDKFVSEGTYPTAFRTSLVIPVY